MFMWRATSFHGELVFPKGAVFNIVRIKIQTPATFAKISAIEFSPHVIASNRKLGPTVSAVSKDNSAVLLRQTSRGKSRYEMLACVMM